jgi:RNA polymerase sigma-70 factor, ECF subfamily
MCVVGVDRQRRTSRGTSNDNATKAITRAATGDHDAFGRFYDLTQRQVHGVVLAVVKNQAIAEEITQEVYVELWRLAPRFESHRGSALAWATTIAHRRAVDRVRSEQSRRNREDRSHVAPVAEFDPVADGVARHLDNATVYDGLALLSPGQRQAVTLAYFSGYTYRQVADVLDLPEGTVKTRIRLGLATLRDHFGVSS